MVNGCGFLVSPAALCTGLLHAIRISNHQKDDKYLLEFGDPEEIRKVFSIMNELDKKDQDEENTEGEEGGNIAPHPEKQQEVAEKGNVEGEEGKQAV
jgi:hypothetical protein